MVLPSVALVLASLSWLVVSRSLGSIPEAVIGLDGGARTLVYDGHGALSAGASSRLLVDYSEPWRSQILDYLFLPNFGANLHLIKVEIGGDAQSTDGTEASHIHSIDPPMHSCNQGYEFWLLQEAKRRNPQILTYALSWGAPGWVGNGTYYSSEGIAYHIEFMNCVRDVYGITLDYMGIWNERPWGTPEWVKEFRAAMTEAGYVGTQIVIPDGWLDKKLTAALQTDDAFREAVAAVGLHYPCNHPAPEILDMGLKFWSSEDYSTVGDWAGAACWGRLFNQNYLRMNMTSTIAWSLIWSVYPGLPYFGNGLMYAYEPWSGYYTVNYPIWTSAHTCQFTAPGWVFLAQGDPTKRTSGMGSGYLPGGGSFVTLVPPTSDPSPFLGNNTVAAASGGDFSLVIEKLEGRCLRCAGQNTTNETVQFQLSGGLGGYPDGPVKIKSLQLFCTNSTVPFLQHLGIDVSSDGTFQVQMYRDSICTVSTVVGARRGMHPLPPDSTPFPYSYATGFDDYNNISQQARYFTDQGGSFVVFEDGGNHVLKQVALAAPGKNQWTGNPFPTTMIGSGTWANAQGEVLVMLDDPQWQSYSPVLFAGLCINVPASRWTTGHGSATPEGICVIVQRPLNSSAGQWMVAVQSSTKGQQVQYQAALDVPFATWISLSLNATGSSFVAKVNSNLAENHTCSDCEMYGSGYIALTSGWNMATFDNFTIAVPPPPPPPKGSWVQSLVMGGAVRRNDFTGPVGGAVRANSGTVQVLALGRYYGHGNGGGVHQLSISRPSDGKEIATVAVNGTAGSVDDLGFIYTALPSKVALVQGETYYLTSTEITGGDYFFGSGSGNPSVTTANSLVLLSSVYFFEKEWHNIDSEGTMYGPLNMLME